jgi:phenylpropionate dioxygenase-like ring-hydroxylating dioxygenase large terminal subunit
VVRDASTLSLAEALAQGWTLPASWYTDAAVLGLERELVFTRAWQYFGRLEQVAEPGDAAPGSAGHIPVAIVRDSNGELRGFVNVCRHRGHEVVTGPGNRKTLQCPYHAWTYGLDGCLKRAPRAEREPGFPKKELSLVPIKVDSWGPFVFVNPDLDAPPLDDVLGDLPAIVARSGVDLAALEFHERREWTLEANWKIGIENYLECYHCPVAHPGFSAMVDVAVDSYRYTTARWTSSQMAPIKPAAYEGNGRKVAYDPHGEVTEAQYHLIWPNCTINIDPGRANLSIDTWIPEAPGRTRGISDQFFALDVPEKLRREMIAFSSQVGAEDDALVESVQRGLQSGMVPQGRLLLGSEKLIQHFQSLVFEALS